MQAQKRCLRSFDDALLPVQAPEKGWRKHISGQDPVEKGDDHWRGQLDGRLLDREHHPAVFAAVAVVLVVTRRARLGGMIVPSFGRRPVLVPMARGVIVTRAIGVSMGQRLALAFRSRRLARDARAEPRVEVAAAEWNRNRQEDGHENLEWTAAVEHTSLEYIRGHGTALRTRGFDFHRAVGPRLSVQGPFRPTGWLPFVAEGGVVARQPAILVHKSQITRENWFAEVVDTELPTPSRRREGVLVYGSGHLAAPGPGGGDPR